MNDDRDGETEAFEVGDVWVFIPASNAEER